MKRIALLLAATAFTAPAFAADVIYDEPIAAPLPLAPVATGWTGLYIGLQGGGAFNGSTPNQQSITTNGFAFDAPIAGFPGGIDGAFGDNFSSSFDSGFIGGAHIGYDYQVDNFVLGALLDINATDIGVRQASFSTTPAVYEITRDLDFLATARLRAGYLVTPSVLAYATGGVAYGEVEYGFNTNSPVVTGNPNSGPAAEFGNVVIDEDKWGYSVGGGMEVLITDNLSFGAEYLYTNLGGGDSTVTLTGSPFDGPDGDGSTTFRGGGDFDFHTVTAKLSYRFN